MIKSIGIYPAIKQKVPAHLLKNIAEVQEDENGVTVRFEKPQKGQPNTKLTLKKDYFRVITEKGTKDADIFLYGFIGQDFWWGDEDMKEESLTDLEVVRVIRALDKEFDRINIRINSPGGSVMHGDPIITAIRNADAEVHTYVDGLAASMAADIWMAGDVRHMSINSKLMIHSTWSVAIGTAKDMRNAAEQLEKFDNAAISTFAAATGWKESEVRERFYDYEDHWMTAKEVEEMGLIDKVEDYKVEQVVEDEKSDMKELVRAFEEVMNEEDEEYKYRQEVEANYSQEEITEQIKQQYGENVSISFGTNTDKKADESPQEKQEEQPQETAATRIKKAKTKLAKNSAFSKDF